MELQCLHVKRAQKTLYQIISLYYIVRNMEFLQKKLNKAENL